MVIMSALIIVRAWKTDKGKHLLVSHCVFELNDVFYCLLYILLQVILTGPA